MNALISFGKHFPPKPRLPSVPGTRVCIGLIHPDESMPSKVWSQFTPSLSAICLNSLILDILTAEKQLDSIVIDIPNPWETVEHSWKALKVGGYFCSYSPLISQVEKTVNELHKHNFIEIKTIENIQREMVVSTHGTRPSFNMLGHTGYLTFARKIL